MAAITKDTSFLPVAPTHSHSYVGVEDDANEIYAGAFVQQTATGRAVIYGDTGGLGIGPIIGVNERNVPDQAGKTYSGPYKRPAATVYVGLFERPIATVNPVTDADMFSAVYAANNHDVCNDPTKPLLGVLVGINNEASTCTVLIGATLAATSSKLAFVTAPLDAATEADGTPLAAWVDGVGATPGYDSGGGEFKNVRWNPNAAPDPIALSFALPLDLDADQDIYVYLLAAKAAAGGDLPTFTVGAYFQTVGTDYDADADAGGVTNAMTDTAKQVQLLVRAIAAANVPASTGAAPSILNLVVGPTATTLPNDDVLLGAAFIVYRTK